MKYILHELFFAIERNRGKKEKTKSMITTAHFLSFLKIYMLDVKLLTEELLPDS